MKVAVFGRTLYAGVMAALLAECGHTVYWCDIFQQDRPEVTDFQDEAVNRLLQQQHAQGFLHYCSLKELGLEIDGQGDHEDHQGGDERPQEDRAKMSHTPSFAIIARSFAKTLRTILLRKN